MSLTDSDIVLWLLFPSRRFSVPL